jgi:hypothetical protein
MDVLLNPLPFSSFDKDVISLEHEYAAAWYAGSQFTQKLSAAQQVGLFWSPQIAGAQTNLPATSGQTWTDSNLNQSTQFVLGTQTPPATVQPVFTGITLGQSGVSGDVSTVFGNGGVLGVKLNSDMSTAAFKGTHKKSDDSMIGFSFDYDFTQVGDGAQLQISSGREETRELTAFEPTSDRIRKSVVPCQVRLYRLRGQNNPRAA